MSRGLINVCGGLILLLACAPEVRAQQAGESNWVIDVGLGVDVSLNGNVNSGAIGILEGQAAAILPNSYGSVYGSGLYLRFGGGYLFDDETEARVQFTFQSADADLVRLGDVGASNLYGQFDDYKTFSLDVGLRRYVPIRDTRIRPFGEVTLGLAFIEEIDVLFAAPQSNLIFDQTDFYDQTAAFTFGLNVGVLVPVAERLDLSLQAGLRRVSGLSGPDQFVGTGLDEITNDSARLTFPIVVGTRFRF